MTDIFAGLPTLSVVTGGGLLFLALVWAAMNAPRIFNSWKVDRIDGSVLDRLNRLEKQVARMDKTIHRQAVQLTRFEIVVLHLVALLVQNGVMIPKHLQEEIDDLTLKPTEEEEEA